eukprot:863124_1
MQTWCTLIAHLHMHTKHREPFYSEQCSRISAARARRCACDTSSACTTFSARKNVHPRTIGARTQSRTFADIAADAVNFLYDAPEIRTVSFVGSGGAGHHIHERASKHGKRVQCNMAAKNHGVLLPDADKESTLNALTAAAFGAAGQRCMALSTAVFVGETRKWFPELREKAVALQVGAGSDPGTDVGPLISHASLERAERIIGTAEAEGAEIVLDGRGT